MLLRPLARTGAPPAWRLVADLGRRGRADSARPRPKPPKAASIFEEQTIEEVEAQTRPHQPVEEGPAAKDERGGPKGKEPTRYGDWERKGRVSDF